VSLARAQRLVLERLGSGSTVLLSVHLAVPSAPSWCDGRDAAGRAVLLVGRAQLGPSEEAQAAVTAVLAALSSGHVPEGVHAVAYAPKASRFIAEIVAGQSLEVLGDGPRGSGKTQAVPAALAGLAELRARAGEVGPLRVLWLHDTLVSASAKTARSLEAPLWAGLWQVRDDRRVAALTIAGTDLVLGDFVGVQDASGQERSRAEAHVIAVEEVVPSLDESGGVPERAYELALTSARLPSRRRVALLTTNPGDTETWPYKRFIEGGGRAGCVRVPIPGEDRLSPEEMAAQRAAFRDSPDLEARLGRGEWVPLQLGALVGEGYDAQIHVAAQRMAPSPDLVLGIGWDGGHSPSAVVGQLAGGQVRVYASLNLLGQGVQECIEDVVRPWLLVHAPWAVDDPRSLAHVIDPSMKTGSEATITQSSEKMIRRLLGGRVIPAATNAWPHRREAVLRLLRPAHEAGRVPLAINPTEDTRCLRQALGGRWYYRQTPDGRVDRSGPKKPNSPWADVGDAFAYLAGWLLRGAAHSTGPRPPYQAKGATSTGHQLRGPVLPSDLARGTVLRSRNTPWR
jgi:hypothetical protein